jgi:hypothetical protein
MQPEDVPPLELANRLTAYKLRQRTADRYFKLLRDEKDPVSGMELMLYEVTETPTEAEMESSLVGAIAVNQGKARTAVVNASVYSEGDEYSRLFNESFGVNEVGEVLYTVKPDLRGFKCSLNAMPLGEKWGYVGALTYLNTLDSRDVGLRVVLADKQTEETVGVFNRTVHFNAGEKRSVQYSFAITDYSREYMIGWGVVDGLTLLENESTSPALEGVRFLAVFC